MFEHLPVICEESVEVIRAKEMPYFVELADQCVKEAKTLKDTVNIMLEPITTNLFWHNEVKVFAVAALLALDELFDRLQFPSEVVDVVKTQVAMSVLAGSLIILRFIDRALETKELEKIL